MLAKQGMTAVHSLQRGQADEGENLLLEYAYVFKRRLKLIASCAVGLAVVVGIWSYAQTPIYQSKAIVVIDQPGASSLDKDNGSRPDISPEYFQTHFELMKSHYVLQRTAQRLRLGDRPEYNRPPSWSQRAQGSLSALLKRILSSEGGGAEPPVEDRESALLRAFSQSIEVMPIRGARLAHVLASSEDPKFAAQAANTLAAVYIERAQELNSQSKEQAAQWFTGHLDELRTKVESSQEKLYMFRKQHGLLSNHERQTVATQKTTELDSELVKAEMKKAETLSRFQQIQSALHGSGESGGINWSSLDALSEVLNSPLIQNLRAQEIRVSGAVAELSDKYGSLHPKLARAKAELQELRDQTRREIQKIYDSIKHEYDSAAAREKAIREAVGRHRKEKMDLEQYEIEHGILEREAESNQHLHDVFLKLTKEADIISGMRNASVYVADPAVPGTEPVKPKKKLNILIGLMIGLLSGFGVAVVLESTKKILSVPHDIERHIPSVSLLGVMPFLPRELTENGRRLLPANGPSAAAESVRIIRTSLLLSNPGDLPPCVLVTSALESEGKTTLAVNLASAIAQLEGVRVMLIDADLRKPTHHVIFDLGNDGKPLTGLVDYLEGQADVEEALHRTEVENVLVVPRGKLPLRPAELLHSKRMSKLLRWGRDHGYHVIVDSPPILPVTDPMVLAPLVDGVLLVVSAGQSTRESVRLAVQRLTASGGRILGIVMQKAQVMDTPYYYYASSEDER
jgi:capsular exopolysaccharide synthesis family protein